MSISSKIENFYFKGNNKDIEYLKQKNIGDILIKGLTETYLMQPENPVKFLSNWLLNEERSKLIVKKQNEQKLVKEEAKLKLKRIQIEADEKNEIKKSALSKLQSEKEKFIERIKSSKDIEEEINDLCTSTEKLVNATGVYIYYLDKKRKIVNLLDNENAHQTEQDVYRIIYYSDSHKELLKDKYLDLEDGIVHEVFNIKYVEEPSALLNSSIGPEDHEKIKEYEEFIEKYKNNIRFVLYDEVLRNPKAKFFREPRLGCLLSIDATYFSSLNEASLQSSIEKLNEFREEQNQIDEERKIKFEELKDLATKNNVNLDYSKGDIKNDLSDLKDNDIDKLDNLDIGGAFVQHLLKQQILDADGNPIDIEGMVNEINNKKATLKDYDKTEKKQIFVLDTLGQDRIFTDEEIDYASKICKTIVETRTEEEKKRLIQMRDLRINNIKQEKEWLVTTPLEKIPELEEAEFKRIYLEKHDGNPPKDDDDKEDEIIWCKTRYIIKNQLLEDDILRLLILDFSKYEFVEYERIFQNVLYFVGLDPKAINFESTNKLNWKVARSFWNLEVLKKVEKYNPYGGKEKHDNPLTKLNRLIQIFGEVDEEKVREYSYPLSRLSEVLKICK
jgi:hypothetical protein